MPFQLSIAGLHFLGNKYNLDFDDSYQYKVAEENGLMILTMNKDFIRVKDKIKVKFL